MPYRAISDTLGPRRLVVVSNRAPVEVRRRPEGRRFVPTVGGLVSALTSVFAVTGGGLWVAWSGGEIPGDAHRPFRVGVPEDKPAYTLRMVRLSDRDVSQFYYGFANRGLWPLSHYFVGRCQFAIEHWQGYQRVNATFAGTLLEELRSGDLVWVQDFHLSLLPAMVRRAAPEVTLGFFWHIPFPEPSVFGILPWRALVLEGMLGSDVIGFHLDSYARNFLACVDRFLGLPVDWDRRTVTVGEREIRVVAWPIGIDTPAFEHLARQPEVQLRAARIRRQLGSERMVLGVDRLDYTKGILERLQGIERFLEQNPQFRRKVTFVQIAVPSRERVEDYRRMKQEIDEAVGRISGRFTRENWVPVRYVYSSVPLMELTAYYCAADVALITPLRDGMNLVAKEYIAAHVDDRGVLILSEFAGAADDLPEALLVNPYHVDDVAGQIRAALTLGPAEAHARMVRLRSRVRDHDIRWWMRGFLGEFSDQETRLATSEESRATQPA